MIVVAIIGLLSAIAIPNFVKARDTSQTNTCINNLRQLDGAVQEWALEHNKATTDTVTSAQVTVEEIEARNPSHVIISPGPCTPLEAGVSNAVVERFGPTTPLLGVCLGHQCIGFNFGATVERAAKLMHGKTD